jgi:two-component system sensor histidine kinase MprB
LAPEDRSVLIGDVLTQLDELTSLVGDLSELARGDVPALTSGIVSLDSVVADAVSVATTHGRSRNVTFNATLHPSLVSGSRNRLERAIGNLLDNALKWSPDGGVVEVSCLAGTVVVRDHGPGISDDDLVHIFDRFYRAPAARGRPGPDWASPSWPRWPGKRGDRSSPATPPEAGPYSGSACPKCRSPTSPSTPTDPPHMARCSVGG